MEIALCDCFRPLRDTDGKTCKKCGLEIMDRRCEACQKDFLPEQTEERSDGKLVCRQCYLSSLDYIN